MLRHLVTAAVAASLLGSGSTVAVAAAASATPTPAPATTNATTTTALADQILIRYRKGTTTTERARIGLAHGLTRLHMSPVGRTDLVVAKGRSAAAVRRELAADPNIEAVSQNFQRHLADDPTGEPYFTKEWGLNNTGQSFQVGPDLITGTSGIDVDGLQALGVGDGSGVTVAVIDDGVDFSHPDLAGQDWTNPGESGGGKETNGVDDDGNGKIDDVHGWDFCNNDNTIHDGTQDDHGTHVAGTIAASLNGVGTVGVAPGVKIMAVKFIDNIKNHCGHDDQAIAAINYVASFGFVPIINASWGGPGFDMVLDLAIKNSGALFVAAAGNESVDMDSLPASERFYPSASTQPNLLSIAAIDQDGLLADFSNFGRKTVDIAAPGVNILSTFPARAGCPSPCYVWLSGTSMAAPHVSGVAALALSRALPGTISPTALRAHLLASGLYRAQTAGLTASSRMVNAYRASDVKGPVAAAPDHVTLRPGSTVGTRTGTALVRWPAAVDDISGVASYALRRKAGSGAWTTIASSLGPSSRVAASAVSFGSTYQFSVRAKDRVGNVGAAATTAVKATLYSDATSMAHYGSGWSRPTNGSALGSRLHTATRAGAWMTLGFTGRSINIIAPRGPTRGTFRVYLDGTYVEAISLRSSSTSSRIVMFAAAWSTNAAHTLKVVVVGTAGHPRVDVDGFVIFR
jgi:subtilisin family serine protease